MPLSRAIAACVLIVLVQLIALLTLKEVGPGYLVLAVILSLAVLTLYGTFSPFSGLLPYGIYNIIVFILALIPVYLLWSIFYKNTERLSELLGYVIYGREITCSCGWRNPEGSKFCNRCASPLPEKSSP